MSAMAWSFEASATLFTKSRPSGLQACRVFHGGGRRLRRMHAAAGKLGHHQRCASYAERGRQARIARCRKQPSGRLSALVLKAPAAVSTSCFRGSVNLVGMHLELLHGQLRQGLVLPQSGPSHLRFDRLRVRHADLLAIENSCRRSSGAGIMPGVPLTAVQISGATSVQRRRVEGRNPRSRADVVAYLLHWQYVVPKGGLLTCLSGNTKQGSQSIPSMSHAFRILSGVAHGRSRGVLCRENRIGSNDEGRRMRCRTCCQCQEVALGGEQLV